MYIGDIKFKVLIIYIIENVEVYKVSKVHAPIKHDTRALGLGSQWLLKRSYEHK